MNRDSKTAIIVIAIVAGLCGVICISVYLIGRYALSRTVAMQPEQASKIGHEIIDYTLPPGYSEMAGMSLFGSKWVMIGSQAANSMAFMLMQFPATSGMSEKDMRQSMEQALAQQGQREGVNLRVVGTQKVVIKGDEVVFTISEGQGQAGTVRQMTGVFPGKGGMVMLMVMGQAAAWDQAAVDAFLASIR